MPSYLQRQVESLEELILHSYPRRKCDPEVRRVARDLCRTVRLEHGFGPQPTPRQPDPAQRLPAPAHFAKARAVREANVEAHRAHPEPEPRPAADPAVEALQAEVQRLTEMMARVATASAPKPAPAPRAAGRATGRSRAR